MKEKIRPNMQIYDPVQKRFVSVAQLIFRLGLREMARKYRVTESAVRKWQHGSRTPSRRTYNRFWKDLF